MSWVVLGLSAYVLLALQTGLRPLWSIGGVEPSLLLILLVYVGLQAPTLAFAWSAMALGLLVDLTTPTGAGVVLLGPAAVGYLAGAYVLVQLRPLVFRDSVLAIAAMTLAVGAFVHLATVALLTVRGLGFVPAEPIEGYRAAAALYERFASLIYTTAVAAPLGWLLLRSTRHWHFAGRSTKRLWSA